MLLWVIVIALILVAVVGGWALTHLLFWLLVIALIVALFAFFAGRRGGV
jgi:predicted membrane protein